MALASMTRIAVPMPSLVVGPSTLPPGPSSAGQVSMASAICGRTRDAATRAPRSPTSSCTVAVATSSADAGPAAFTASIMTNTPTRSSRLFAVTRSPSRERGRMRVAVSPGPHELPHAVGRQPHVDREVGDRQVLAAVGRVDQVAPGWCRRRPPDPRARAPGPAGRPASGVPPPMGMTRRKPRSSTWVTISPISSMWAASITAAVAPAPRGEVAERVDLHPVDDRRELRADDLRTRSSWPRSRGPRRAR